MTEQHPKMQKRIIITGADSVAREIASKFLKDGCALAVCDLRQDAISSIKEEYPQIHAVQANMAVAADVTDFMNAAIDQLGGVDFLVNVVGVSGPTKPTEDITLQEWDDCFAANTRAMFLTAKAAIPHLKSQKSGGIINFSSSSTRTLLPNRSPYIASKYAVEGLTKNLARELGPFNVRANAILPGAIDNQRLRDIMAKVAARDGVATEQAMETALKYISMRSVISFDELASTVHFLCSEPARHITGQLIAVDGNLEWEA